MTRHAMSAGPRGEPYAQRGTARPAPEAVCVVRERLRRRPNGFRRGLQAGCAPLARRSPAGTRIASDDAGGVR